MTNDSRTFEHHLPFDQFGRYSIVADAVEAAKPFLGWPLRLLDVGGFFRTARGAEILPAKLFFPDDHVEALDMTPAVLPGYTQGDGRGLPFPDESFDLVISCDTLEHVPASDRPAFWKELLRVARHGVLLIAPFASPETDAAEELVFAYIKMELGGEQPQLKEHRGYGLPDLMETGMFLLQEDIECRVFPSGEVHAWLTMMMFKHYLYARNADLDLHEALDRYYTHFFSADERREPAYRHLVVAAKTKEPDWLSGVDDVLQPTLRERNMGLPPDWSTTSAWLSQVLHTHSQATEIERLQQTVVSQSSQIVQLQQKLQEREDLIKHMTERAGWSASQARAARDELAAIKQGVVLRLLNRIQGRGE